MRLTVTLAAVGLALASTACGRSGDDTANASLGAEESTINVDDTAMAGNMDPAMNAAAPAQSADTFVTMVAGSDQYEIESGKLAQSKATNAALKSFGTMLVTDHTKSTADLKTAAASASPAITPPATLPAEMKAKIDALKAASGAEFDRLFLQQQKDNHQMALDTLKGYSASGDQASLKTFATNTAPVVQRHLDALNAIKL